MAVLAAVLALAQHRARTGGDASLPERVAQRTVWPIQSALVNGGRVVRNVAIAAGRGRRLVQENERLRQQVAELEAERIRLYGYYLENKAIKEQLGWDPKEPPPPVAARVIDWSPGLWRRRVTIEANRELEQGNIVRTGAGLVGRVIEAAGKRGVVVLLLDAEHAVAARVQREDGDHGIIYAAPDVPEGEQLLLLSKLPQGADVRAGDRVISSGLGGVYPADLPIGVVERVERSPVNVASITAYVRPYVDFDHLDFVRVIRRGE